MNVERKSLITLLFIGIAVAFVGASSIHVPVSEWYKRNDFAHYYLTSALVREGTNPYKMGIELPFAKFGFINQPKITVATNPPPLALFVVPFTYLKPKSAFWLWSILQYASLVGALLLSFRLVANYLKIRHLFLLLALFSTTYCVLSHLRYGQTQAFMLLLIIIGVSSLYSPSFRLRLAGIFLWGVATSLKLFTWPLVFVALRYAGWRGVLAFCFGGLFFWIPLVSVFGLDIFKDYFSLGAFYAQSTVMNFFGANSLIGASYNVLSAIGEGAIFVKSLPYLSALSIALILLGTIFLLRVYKEPFGVCAAVLVLSCMFSPTTWSHYMVLVFPALTLLYVNSLTEGKVHFVDFAIAFLLVGLTLGRLYNAPPLWQAASSCVGIVGMAYILALILRVGSHRT